ncbi:hypothetical protein N0V82_001498 [Gnomoniopsis sp. IMI 355080]|nr:hypothetical protein N0V82_001498 [Gnomoniopsis sp. IMI 355080]
MPFPFDTVCDLLQTLEGDLKRRRQGKGSTQIVKDWFTEYREEINRQDVDAVALLSTLLPERRTDRVFSIREKRLESIVASACGLGCRKTKLRRWETDPRAGLDFAECVEEVLAQSPNDEGQLVTVEEVDAVLDHLAARNSFSSAAVRSSRAAIAPQSCKEDHLLASLFRRLSPRNAKWLCRVVLKNFEPVIVPEYALYSSYHPLLPTVLKIHDSFAVALALLQQHLRYSEIRGVSLSKHDLPRIIKPQFGVKVGRKTWLKARSIKHCLEMGHGLMSCEKKMDGEYCQIHVDLSKGHYHIQIFSKSGKDSTMDRLKLHPAIKSSLRLGTKECKFTKRCILEGELVVYSDLEKRILEFDKIRKHVNRSGRFIGTDADSQAHSWERLMVVYFDVLLIDDDSMLNVRHSDRRKRLSELVHCQEGQAALVESRVINFSSHIAADELRRAFASCIIYKEEGLVLKPDEPYFSFGVARRKYASCCLKLKKGYVKGLGDIGDFAVVGARCDPTRAKALGLPNVKFTHFYLACLTNKDLVTRFQAKPRFKVVNEVELNRAQTEIFMRHVFVMDVSVEENSYLDLELPEGIMQGKRMTAVFLEPAVFDMTCFAFGKEPNTSFWSLRFPYVSKIHTDRHWRDCISFHDLQALAEADQARVDEEDSQEMTRWIKTLEEKTPKRRRKASEPKSQSTDNTSTRAAVTDASPPSDTRPSASIPVAFDGLFPANAAMPDFSIASDAHLRDSITGENTGPRKRKRRRGASPGTPRLDRQGVEVIDLTMSPSSQVSQRSSRQPLEDITSAVSSQGNIGQASVSPLSPASTFHEEPDATTLSAVPAGLPNAASSQMALASSSPKNAAKKTLTPSSTSARSSAQSTPTPVSSCQFAGANCALANYFILLSPCVANMPWLSEDLLPSHGTSAIFRDIPSWLASASLQTNYSRRQPRLVLVEARRPESTKGFLTQLRAEPLRGRNGAVDMVTVYDWRLIEAITEAEKAYKKSDGRGTRQKAGTGAHAREVWRRHYVGTC